MADNERQEQTRPLAPVQVPRQGPGDGPIQGPGMMPWGAPPPGAMMPPGGPQQPGAGAVPPSIGGPGMQPGIPERRVQQPPQGGTQQMPQEPRRSPGYIDPNWKPSGSTMHDRMVELVQRYMDSALQDARGIQGMMMRDSANRMYPRIEATIRGMSEEELRNEIAAIQSQMKKVLGTSEAKGRTSKAGTVKQRGRKQRTSGRR